MRTSDFDYDLPPEYIAQTPAEPRDASRLLVLDRLTGTIEHRTFRDIRDYLRPGDLLVANESRVLAARLFGFKAGTGGRVELLLLRKVEGMAWEALVRGRRMREGSKLTFPEARLTARIAAVLPSGARLVDFSEPAEPWLTRIGVIPLPPYIHLPLSDAERYQTVYSRVGGSVAAPTAGLHFTPELMLELREMGIEFAFVTLNIGLDTFQPVKEEAVEDHRIHTEWCSLDAGVAGRINQARLEGRRVVAVGTTAVRTLESAAGGSPAVPGPCPCQTVQAFSGPTGLFIYPGYRFKAVDALITNFHLPRSTLLMLVSAFAERESILHAYEEAKRLGYRFFSFGDAMLIK